MTETQTQTDRPTPTPMPATRIALAVVAMVILFALLIFLPAGRIDWPPGWIYLAVVALFVCVSWACLRRWNPDLIERRMRFGKGTKTWDKVWSALISPVMIAIYVVAGLDARDRTSSLSDVTSVTVAAWVIGLTIFVLGSAMFTWSMTVNPFFEKTVRIQTDRGHRVIDTGPYAFLRHPGYVGFIAWTLATPLLLVSAWAFVPALVAVIGIVIRTALEDRTLHAELPGYPEYAARVRYRLLSGVW